MFPSTMTLQNISESRTFILVSGARLFFAIGIAAPIWSSHGSKFLIEHLVLPRKEGAQSECQQPIEKHEGRAHPHPHAVVRAVLPRVESRAEERAALPDEVQNGNACTALRIGALVVEDPGQDVTDAGENPCGSKEHPSVPGAGGRSGGEKDIANGADDGKHNDRETTLLSAVGNVRCGDSEKESEEVRRCGKALCLDA